MSDSDTSNDNQRDLGKAPGAFKKAVSAFRDVIGLAPVEKPFLFGHDPKVIEGARAARAKGHNID